MKKSLYERVKERTDKANEHFAAARAHLIKFNRIIRARKFGFIAKLPEGFEKVVQ